MPEPWSKRASFIVVMVQSPLCEGLREKKDVQPVRHPSILHVQPAVSHLVRKQSTVAAFLADGYTSSQQVFATAQGREPLLEVLIGNSVFYALLDSGASISLMDQGSFSAARGTITIAKQERQAL